MPRLQTVFSLALAIALFVGYRKLPTLLADNVQLLPVIVTQLTTLTLQLPGQAPLTLQRDHLGQWQLPQATSLPLNQDRIHAFVHGLTTASARPAKQWQTIEPVRVLLSAPGQETETLELGQRLRPFQQQRVRLNGVVYDVDWDFSSALGLWCHADVTLPNAITAAGIWHLEEPIVRIELENPFATYLCQRLDEVAVEMPRDLESSFADEPVMRWSCQVNGKPALANIAGIHRWQQQLAYLPVQHAIGEDDNLVPVYRLHILTASGRRLQIDAAPPAKIRQMQPQQSAVMAVTNHAFNHAFVRGRTLVRELPQVQLDLRTANAILGDRQGVAYELRRNEQGQWRMVRPPVEQIVYTPPAVAGAPPPLDMVSVFLQQISNHAAVEAFDPDDPARRRLLHASSQQPAARLRIRTTAGTVHTLQLSREVVGSGCRFLQINNQVLVVQTSPETLVPERQSFFAPEN